VAVHQTHGPGRTSSYLTHSSHTLRGTAAGIETEWPYVDCIHQLLPTYLSGQKNLDKKRKGSFLASLSIHTNPPTNSPTSPIPTAAAAKTKEQQWYNPTTISSSRWASTPNVRVWPWKIPKAVSFAPPPPLTNCQPAERSTLAVQDAIEWLDKNSSKPLEELTSTTPAQALGGAAAASAGDLDADGDRVEASGTAASLKCTDCGKLFSSPERAQFHATRTFVSPLSADG